MDFSPLYQLRSKKFWWVDTLFYIALALMLATLLSYGIFLIQTALDKKQIAQQTLALQTVGTEQQKAYEKEVVTARQKINDFNELFKNHQFASHAFAFIQDESLPYIWFRQFVLDQKNDIIQLYGETENIDNLSRQVASFERNPYVKKVSLLNSQVGAEGKIDFNLNLVLDEKIFSYTSLDAVLPSPQAAAPEGQGAGGAQPGVTP